MLDEKQSEPSENVISPYRKFEVDEFNLEIGVYDPIFFREELKDPNSPNSDIQT